MTSLPLLLVGAWLWAWPCAGAPTITSPWGTVSGVTWSTPSGANYSAYLAIPYALPPVGERRFQKPQPHPGASSVHNGTRWGALCMQPGAVGVSEDCLTLNVFVPAPPASPPPSGYDVIVWIHGGGYRIGSADGYDPQSLVVDNGLLVVVIQYRLGPLGFISTGDSLLPGNYGLWDQQLALVWVRDNIRAFGGNPSSVTIMGESAGGGSVAQHLLSPHSSGLFQRIIAQSGSATAFWADYPDPASVAIELALSLGCLAAREDYVSQRQAMVACLRRQDAEAVSNGVPTVELDNWTPTVDGDFVVQKPRQALQDTDFLASIGFFDRDVIMGVNNNEGVSLVGVYPLEDIRNVSLYRHSTGLYLHQLFGAFNPDLLDVMEYRYTYPRKPATPGLTHEQGVFDSLSDLGFVGPTVEYIQAHARGGPGGGRSYLYLFEHFPKSALYTGMAHGQDELFLFPFTAHTSNASMFLAHSMGLTLDLDSTDLAVARYFAAFIAHFAKTGDPNPGLSGLVAATWPEFTPTEEHYLAFGSNASIQQHLYADRMGLYLDILPRMQRRWLDSAASSQAPPTPNTCETTTVPAQLERFNLSVGQAEDLIIGLIAAAGVLLVLLLLAVFFACSHRAAGSGKYRM